MTTAGERRDRLAGVLQERAAVDGYSARSATVLLGWARDAGLTSARGRPLTLGVLRVDLESLRHRGVVATVFNPRGGSALWRVRTPRAALVWLAGRRLRDRRVTACVSVPESQTLHVSVDPGRTLCGREIPPGAQAAPAWPTCLACRRAILDLTV